MKEVKPKVVLKYGETIQHPSGILEKAITREDLEKNPQKYVYTHPTFYENAAELQRHYSLSAKVQSANGTHERVQSATINGAKTAVFVGNGNAKTAGRNKKLMQELLSKMQSQKPMQPAANAEKGGTKKGSRKNQNNNNEAE